jgi:hypothetical protein
MRKRRDLETALQDRREDLTAIQAEVRESIQQLADDPESNELETRVAEGRVRLAAARQAVQSAEDRLREHVQQFPTKEELEARERELLRLARASVRRSLTR